MPTGKVKWFNSKKGYGFITDDETEKDIFLHVSALEDSKLRILKEDQKLKFEIKKDVAALFYENVKIWENEPNHRTHLMPGFLAELRH